MELYNERMRVPSQLQPFLHKSPIITIIVIAAVVTIQILGAIGNIQDILEGLGILGSIIHFVLYERAGILAE